MLRSSSLEVEFQDEITDALPVCLAAGIPGNNCYSASTLYDWMSEEKDVAYPLDLVHPKFAAPSSVANEGSSMSGVNLNV